ncbi:Zea mays Retrotransposon Opie-2 [Phytophthora cinnamomi]|uniref:Zea mays Retrotransposon Opie-2 n=1 Tax=Phytophthora cinnamomi TaxID=4785 RepID=UPI00355AB65D|nr:Zea mays Retrotransposon Opie-2 [Phytophthora cinnamomi]
MQGAPPAAPVPVALSSSTLPTVSTTSSALTPATASSTSSTSAPVTAPSTSSTATPAAPPSAPVPDHEKKNGKTYLRNIEVNAFSGAVQSGDFDTKAREFRDELDEQIADAQVLAGQGWSDEVTKTILKTFLTGMAPLLLGVDIADRIKNERKRLNETYREFADRLLPMTDTLEGGKTQRANTKTDLECEDPERELQKAIAVLSRKAGSDGRLPDRTKHNAKSQVTSAEAKGKAKAKARTPPSRPKSQKKPETSKKGAAEAHGGGRAKEETEEHRHLHWKTRHIVCFECGGEGHTAAFHRKYLRNEPVSEDSNEASAQLADVDNSEEDEDVETAGADVDDDDE